MSFTGSGECVSLGYPWVLPGYEGELQERMFDRVYGFASGKSYGGKTFAQRFRSQWVKQIDFFSAKGFKITERIPIYGGSVHALLLPVYFGAEIDIQSGFDFSGFAEVARRSSLYREQDLESLGDYLKAVQFDFSVSCYWKGRRVGYAGIAYRKDTRYGEIILPALEEGVQPGAFAVMFASTVQKLDDLGADVVSVNCDKLPVQTKPEILGLRNVSESIMMMKSIE